jgi:SIR2-like domain/TIR domain
MNSTGKGPNSEAPDAADQELTIFINYRRDDTDAEARELGRALKQRFGKNNVYVDVDQESGIDWLQRLKSRGAGSGVILALIGRQWLATLEAASIAAAAGGPEDFVRSEIQWALRDWRGVLIPVLFDVSMPKPADLPRAIRGLCRRQAAELRHASYDRDLTALIERLQRISDMTAPAPEDAMETDGAQPSPAESSVVSDVPAPSHDHYVRVVRAMLRGRVVPVLGPSVRGSLPDARYLAQQLANEFGLPTGADLAQVAQHLAVTEGDSELYRAVKDILAAESRPRPIHRFLAAFPGLVRSMGLSDHPQLIISTNYDSALEQAFEEANEPFDYAFYLASQERFVHLPWGEHAGRPVAELITEPKRYHGFPMDDEYEPKRTVVVKFHGATDGSEAELTWTNNYVITEDNYIDYRPTQDINEHVPIQILAKLTASRCLFIGYTMRDWNARLLLRRIWRGQSASQPSWAVVAAPDELEKASWRPTGVELYASSSTDYVNGLRAVLAEWPQQQLSPA